MKKIDLKRSRPERSEKRKHYTGGGKKLISLRPRVTPGLKCRITREAAELGVSESLYLNMILETRDQKKIKKTYFFT